MFQGHHVQWCRPGIPEARVDDDGVDLFKSFEGLGEHGFCRWFGTKVSLNERVLDDQSSMKLCERLSVAMILEDQRCALVSKSLGGRQPDAA